MIDLFAKFFSRFQSEGQESITTPKDLSVVFELKYHDLIVGTLRLDAGQWEFAYSPQFQEQSEVQPLVAFPDKQKRYVSERLWPFFMSRIPSTDADATSDVELLKQFGKRTISNPFELVVAR